MYHCRKSGNLLTEKIIQNEFDDMVSNESFDLITIYYPSVFSRALELSIPFTQIDAASAIARTIEHGLPESFNILINHPKFKLLTPTNLRIRWIKSSDLLCKAAKIGWIDPELINGLTNIQRLFRRKPLIKHKYSGGLPNYDEYYYGYRHALHYLRYNPKTRYKLHKYIVEKRMYGTCIEQAYLDYHLS